MNKHPVRTIPEAVLHTFSMVILQIQRLAQECSAPEFHTSALSKLRSLISFDKAWWGRSALIDGLPVRHSSHLFKLSPEFLQDWESIRADDVTIKLNRATPGRSVWVDARASSPGLKWLGERHDIGEFICISLPHEQTQLVDHLTLYRASEALPFTHIDRLLLDASMPYLNAGVTTNQIQAFRSRRDKLIDSVNLAFAVCDKEGVLYSAEDGFLELILAEWPKWHGPKLPSELRQPPYKGVRCEVQVDSMDDLLLLVIRKLSPIDSLSIREIEVAQRFADGSTYKEIAQDLKVAPNTVRHHIRSIYTKLGVNDKTRFAQLIHPPPLN
ncbi:response regulator transcription factor [Pseudomonas syringae]|uniref:response regulator transcription factor n=1 Tax=Pseudomonas syringae TaxID=317 RepID=UPI001F175CA3|nr:helix-turn-helix transcriptional regulator [Pseudomonas syringae]MCF5724128.1 helix-turn-helix transcriptional regulator [Pseudomonas syringae]